MNYREVTILTAFSVTAFACSSALAQETGSDPAIEEDGLISVAASADLANGRADAAMFDTDRGVNIVDRDGDGFPDLTESYEGTNPIDATSFPGAELSGEGENPETEDFPAPNCRPGFRQAGSRLCISNSLHAARTYANAMVFCKDRRSAVAAYSDLRYLYLRTSLDGAYNPNGRWIGNFVDDDRALCGNRSVTFNNDPDISNFEGKCSRFDTRAFWCAHERQ